MERYKYLNYVLTDTGRQSGYDDQTLGSIFSMCNRINDYEILEQMEERGEIQVISLNIQNKIVELIIKQIKQ